MTAELPPPSSHLRVDTPAVDAELDAALSEVRSAKTAHRGEAVVRRRTTAAMAAASVVAAMFGVAWLGGVAGAWVLLFIGLAGVPVAAGGWLAYALWSSWKEPLATPSDDDAPEP